MLFTSILDLVTVLTVEDDAIALQIGEVGGKVIVVGKQNPEVSTKLRSLIKPISASEERFDQLTLAVAAKQPSRGQVLKALGAALILSGPLSALWPASASAQQTYQCTPNDDCSTVCGTYTVPPEVPNIGGTTRDCYCALSRGNLATVSCVQDISHTRCSSQADCDKIPQGDPLYGSRCFVFSGGSCSGARLCVNYC
jgi:hypothetical protein